MRTLEEIRADLKIAHKGNDAGKIFTLSDELHELGTLEAMALEANSRGTAHRIAGSHPDAIEWFEKALALNEDLGNYSGMAIVSSNIGNVYRDTGSYPEALEMYEQTLAMFEEQGNRRGVAGIANSIGGVYWAMGSKQEALHWFEQSLASCESLGDVAGVANAAGNIGVVHGDLGSNTEALKWLEKALELYEEVGQNIAVSIGNVGAVLLRLNRPDEARVLFKRMDSMHLKSPIECIGLLELKAALEEHDVDLASAKTSFKEVLEIAKTHGMRSKEATTHKELRDLAQKMNDFQAYIEHNNEYTRITEEIRGKEATIRVAVLAKEKEIRKEREERERERALLYGALPKSVADRKLRGEDVSGDHFDNVSVVFLDIVKFTTISDRVSPGHVVHLLKSIFKICDDVCDENGITKIKTIGDSYMAVGGVPEPLADHVQRAAKAALEMLTRLKKLDIENVGDIKFRIGLHCGPVVAGIVGEQRLQYDVWGDTVNVASRMESTSEPNRIQVSEAFARAIHGSTFHVPSSTDLTANHLEPGTWSMELMERGEIEIKGKGPLTTYWLEARP